MRYVGLIAIINFLALAIVDDLLGYDLVGGVLGAFFISLFAIPFAIIVGFPILLIARRIKTGSALVLIPLGALAGVGTPLVVTTLMGQQLNTSMAAVGAILGVLSSALWWALVERWPDQRAYFD